MTARTSALIRAPRSRTGLALLGIVGLASVLYLWQLDSSGYANTYYAMAAQAGSQSWSSFFFGSLDAGDFITLDKPPGAVWPMALSVRLLGLSPWSILLPQALAGIATVVVLFDAVRRTFDTRAGLIAALVMALTPIAVVIFRYDNPDAMLTLLLVGAAWSLVRLIESGRTRWVVVAAILVGFGFLTKYLQAFVVLPAFALVLLVSAPGDLRRRLGQAAVAVVTVVIASGWWVAAVSLVPSDVRPYIGGSTDGTVLDLVLGYDGLGRLFGQGPSGAAASGTASPTGGFGGPGGGMFGGASGLLRMLNDEWGGQIAWLLPAALAALAGGLWLRRRGPRTDPVIAGYLLWGGWLVTHVVVFSLSAGIIHPYYAVVMAPAIAALVGAGASGWWAHRGQVRWLDGLAVLTILITVAWAWVLLGRTPDFLPGAGLVAVALGAAAVGILLASRWLPRAGALAAGGAVLALVAMLIGPTAYAVESAQTAYGGGDPSAGPELVAGRADGLPDGVAGGSSLPGGAPPGLGMPGDQSPVDPSGGSVPGAPLPGLPLGGRPPTGGPPGGARPGIGSPADASVDSALAHFLIEERGSTTWIVAVDSAGQAAPIQLATGMPVMAMGGFSGGDDALSADELARYVASGRLRFVLMGGAGGRALGGMVPAGADRVAWVAEHCTVVELQGTEGLYDCAAAGAAARSGSDPG